MDECRNQFEAWYGKEYSNYALTLKEGDKYTNFDTELAWQSWKKAKAAGMREAAKICEMQDGEHDHIYALAIREAAERVERNQ